MAGWPSIDGSAQSIRVPLPMLKVMFAEISVSARSRSLNAVPKFTIRVLNAVAVVPLVATTVSIRLMTRNPPVDRSAGQRDRPVPSTVAGAAVRGFMGA